MLSHFRIDTQQLLTRSTTHFASAAAAAAAGEVNSEVAVLFVD